MCKHSLHKFVFLFPCFKIRVVAGFVIPLKIVCYRNHYGIGVRLEIIKSRVSQAGQYVNLVYDKNNGIDSLRSSILYAKELGLTGGNKNSFYFTSHPDQKFKLKTVHEEFKERRELYKVMYSNIIPVLEKRLTTIEESDLDVLEEESDYSY